MKDSEPQISTSDFDLSADLLSLMPAIVTGLTKATETILKLINDTFGGPEQFQEAMLKASRNAAIFAAALPAMEARLKAAEKSVFEGLLDYSWFFDPKMNANEFAAFFSQ